MSADYTAYAGDDLQIAVTVTTQDGDPAWLAGATATYVISRHLTPKVTKTTAEGAITVSGDDNNIFLIDIDAADTVLFPPGTYQHELKFTDIYGYTYTAIYGDVVFIPTAIRP